MSNTITPAEFKALKERFNGQLSPEAALAALRAASQDKTLPPIFKLGLASAFLDLQTGRSVQSTMARLRRAVGLDKAKPNKTDW